MDICRNVTFPGEYQQEQVISPICPNKLSGLSTSSLDDLFSAQNTESDLSLEWLSVFVEDCLSSSGNCLTTPSIVQTTNLTPKPSKDSNFEKTQKNPTLEKKFAVPSKARSKRRRITVPKSRNPLTSWSNHLVLQSQSFQFQSSDPPLLQQTYWLADSELIVPKKEEEEEEEEEDKVVMVNKENNSGLGSLEGSNGQQSNPRRCSHCLSQRTPQWRAGPLGPKTLCNACGVRYKSGRLLPEYRPAKSPTFVSYLHSNSHKKVMEMRMSPLSSMPTNGL